MANQAHATIEYEGFVITGDNNFPAQKRITRTGAGVVPEQLRGIFTGFQAAKDAINVLKSSKQKSKANAKADTTAGDEQVRKGDDNGGKSA